MLRLLPVSQGEELRAGGSVQPLWQRLMRGGFPELVAEADRDRTLWHSSYVQTYLEREFEISGR